MPRTWECRTATDAPAGLKESQEARNAGRRDERPESWNHTQAGESAGPIDRKVRLAPNQVDTLRAKNSRRAKANNGPRRASEPE